MAINKKNARSDERPGRRYPWSIWFGKDSLILKRGKDYNGHGYTMAVQVRNAAHRYGIKVNIEVLDNGESLQVNVLGRKKQLNTSSKPRG